jgi:hypothetical protein
MVISQSVGDFLLLLPQKQALQFFPIATQSSARSEGALFILENIGKSLARLLEPGLTNPGHDHGDQGVNA